MSSSLNNAYNITVSLDFTQLDGLKFCHICILEIKNRVGLTCVIKRFGVTVRSCQENFKLKLYLLNPGDVHVIG